MSKVSSLLIIALLVCSITLTCAARPSPALLHQGKEKQAIEEDGVMEESESCKGLNDEECLMRRTLVAHTDYIYTQQQNP